MKKKILLLLLIYVLFPLAQVAAEELSIPQTSAKESVSSAEKITQLTDKERKKIFKKRNKEVKKLVKKYHKASAEQKPLIKAQLAQIVSDATDEGIAWSRQRISMEKANLRKWERKIIQQERNLSEVKARRVDEILSGEAERRHKQARKRWKKELKNRKKDMK